VLGDALMGGTLTSAQHDAIYRGLGAPPEAAAAHVGGAGVDSVDGDSLEDDRADTGVEEVVAAWETAAAQLFEDEGGAWIDAIVATALRPRRGGPRFVDAEEKARAGALVADPRRKDQLAYDLMIDVLRAGALADAESVFGTRQAGIRIVTTRAAHIDAVEGRAAVALLEDSDTALPGWLVATHRCDPSTRSVILDEYGNPLDLGREARLYTSKQRVALAVRDGGCRISDCDRPASYCEAHHIDPYGEGGCTDIDRGILLCSFHHLNLHHCGWRITRDGTGEFMLHRPGLPPMPLPMRLPRRYAFGDLSSPRRRFRPAA
jgi:hypothetical protein